MILLTALMLSINPALAGLQEPCPAPALGEPVPFCRLHDGDKGLGEFVPARYPPVLQSAGIAGKVRVELIVDRHGKAGPKSIRVLSSSNKAFEEPFREAIVAHRFPQSVYAGRPTDVRLQLVAEFLLPMLDSVPSVRVSVSEVTPWGYTIRFEQKPIWRAWPAASLSSEDSAAVLAEGRRVFGKPTSASGARDAVPVDVRIYDVWTSDVVIAGVGRKGQGSGCDFVRVTEPPGWRLLSCREHRVSVGVSVAWDGPSDP